MKKEAILHAQNFSICHMLNLNSCHVWMVQHNIVDTCFAWIWPICSVCYVIHFSDLGTFWVRTHYVWHIKGRPRYVLERGGHCYCWQYAWRCIWMVDRSHSPQITRHHHQKRNLWPWRTHLELASQLWTQSLFVQLVARGWRPYVHLGRLDTPTLLALCRLHVHW